MDACHDFLKTKLSSIEGRSLHNGRPKDFMATSPDGKKRFTFGLPVYRPHKAANSIDSSGSKDEEKEKNKIVVNKLASLQADRDRTSFFHDRYMVKQLMKDREQMDRVKQSIAEDNLKDATKKAPSSKLKMPSLNLSTLSPLSSKTPQQKLKPSDAAFSQRAQSVNRAAVPN